MKKTNEKLLEIKLRKHTRGKLNMALSTEKIEMYLDTLIVKAYVTGEAQYLDEIERTIKFAEEGCYNMDNYKEILDELNYNYRH